MTNNIDTFLLDFNQKLSRKMQKIIDTQIRSDGLKIIFDPISYSLFTSGKRLRPAISNIISTSLGYDFDRSLYLSSAIEFVHTYSLIHDDLPAMDNDDYRRGMPSCHKKFSEALAILAGDSLLTMAFEILSSKDLHDNAEIRCKIINSFARAIGPRGMAGGQALDIEHKNQRLDKEEYLYMQKLKTANLFEFSAYSGAVLANANNEQLLLASEFGQNFGKAFQLYDDLQDLAQDKDSVFIEELGGKFSLLNMIEDHINKAKDAISKLNNDLRLIQICDDIIVKAKIL